MSASIRIPDGFVEELKARVRPSDVIGRKVKLKKQGKEHEFHRYDGAGHGFWYYDRPAYRPEQAMDSWGKTLAFFGENLSEG